MSARSSIPGTRQVARHNCSHDWQVTDIFVPEEQSFPILYDGPSRPAPLHQRLRRLREGLAWLRSRSASRAMRSTPSRHWPGPRPRRYEHPRDSTRRTSGWPRRGPAACRTRLPLRDRARTALQPDLVRGTQRDLRASIRLASAHAAQSASEARGPDVPTPPGRPRPARTVASNAASATYMSPPNTSPWRHQTSRWWASTSSVSACRRGGEAPRHRMRERTREHGMGAPKRTGPWRVSNGRHLWGSDGNSPCTRLSRLTRVTAHQSALPKFAYPGLPNLAVPALGAWRQNLVCNGVG